MKSIDRTQQAEGIRSNVCSESRRFTPRPSSITLRSGMSLIEVLISMFVLLFGLMGVAAIFPVGNHFVVEGEKFDLGSALAQNAFEELKARGLLKPQFWHYADPINNLNASTVTRYNPDLGEHETLVMQPRSLGALVDRRLNPSGFNPNHGLFNIDPTVPRTIGPGHAFVIDPIGTAAGIDPNSRNDSIPNLDLFPLSYLDSPNLENPWRIDNVSNQPGESIPLSGTRWPVRRVSVHDAAADFMRTSVGETIFRLRDDLAIEKPDESDIPSRQLWRTSDVAPDGTANNTIDDTIDDQLLHRQYKGDYSWLATIVPTTRLGWQALQPSDENYGEIACDVSVVVFRKRDFTPSSESENRIDAELLPGGELVVYSPKNASDRGAYDDVNRALKGVRPGNWMALMGVDQSSGDPQQSTFGDFVMKWYRIIALDTDKSATGEIELDRLGGSSVTVVGRRLMLIGPDWPAVPLEPGGNQNYLPYIPNLRAGFFPGAVSVVTKPIRMEHSSLWSLE